MKKNKTMIVVFLTPAVILFLGIFLYPIVRTVIMSLFKIEGVTDPMSPVSYTHLDVYKRQDIYREKPIMAVQLIERINKKAYCLHQDKHPQAVRLISNILEEMRTKKELYEESVRGCLLALLIEAARLNEDNTCLLYTSRCV